MSLEFVSPSCKYSVDLARFGSQIDMAEGRVNISFSLSNLLGVLLTLLVLFLRKIKFKQKVRHSPSPAKESDPGEWEDLKQPSPILRKESY